MGLQGFGSVRSGDSSGGLPVGRSGSEGGVAAPGVVPAVGGAAGDGLCIALE
jgi:hypothetical protein